MRAAALLLDEARSTADKAVELQQFTRRLHEQLSAAEKQRVVEMLWQVALADSRLDKHEDHLVRRIAELHVRPALRTSSAFATACAERTERGRHSRRKTAS